MILGIDPGLTGGLAIIKDDGSLFTYAVMPSYKVQTKRGGSHRHIDIRVLDLWMEGRLDVIDRCYLELAASRPGQGAQSTFKFGQVFGAIEAVLVLRKIPYQLVHPATWSCKIHAGISKTIKPKDRSKMVMKRMYPNLVNDVVHDGVIDAFLIAQWGRQYA
jgi:crossover junction endodeoxyribonuclease RuvC